MLEKYFSGDKLMRLRNLFSVNAREKEKHLFTFHMSSFGTFNVIRPPNSKIERFF